MYLLCRNNKRKRQAFSVALNAFRASVRREIEKLWVDKIAIFWLPAPLKNVYIITWAMIDCCYTSIKPVFSCSSRRTLVCKFPQGYFDFL